MSLFEKSYTLLKMVRFFDPPCISLKSDGMFMTILPQYVSVCKEVPIKSGKSSVGTSMNESSRTTPIGPKFSGHFFQSSLSTKFIRMCILHSPF